MSTPATETSTARAGPTFHGVRVGTLLSDIRRVLRLSAVPRWVTAGMVGLGLAASLAETLGVSLIILFVYLAMGRLDEVTTTNGAFGEYLGRIAAASGSSLSLAAIIFVLIIARGLLAMVYSIIGGAVKSGVSEIARNGVHEQYLTVSYDFIRRHDPGYLLEVLATESWSIAHVYMSCTRILINLCSIIVFLAFLLTLSYELTITAVVASLLLSIVLRVFAAPARALGHETKRLNEQMAERSLVTLQGMRTIRAFGQESAHHRGFQRSSAAARRVSHKLERLYAFLNPTAETGYLAVLCLIIATGQYLNISFATTLAAIALLYRLQPHLRELEGNLIYLAQVETSLRSVLAMLDKSDKVYPPPGERLFEHLHDELRFERVTFCYAAKGKPALEDASFRIPASGTTALVGVSGAGKTTIVNLLLRLYRPDQGRILVDGVPLDDIRRTDWLTRLAVAGQDIDLVEGTISDNIRMAREEAEAQRIMAAAELAGLGEMIKELPEGFDTWIGQQGMNLSSGQRQRLGLARAVVRDPDLLILDEAMSALDRGLEDRLRTMIDERFAGRTVLLITHRVETVLSADHVICIEGGRIVQEGIAATLLEEADGALSRLLNRAPASN